MKNKILEEIGFRLKQARNDKGYTPVSYTHLRWHSTGVEFNGIEKNSLTAALKE